MDGSLDRRSQRGAWVAVALGPASWFGALMADFALEPVACRDVPWLLPCLAVSFTVVLALNLYAAARGILRPRRFGAAAETRFIGWLGVMVPVVFFITLLWTLLATTLFSACQ